MIDVVRLIRRMDNRFAAIDGRSADSDRGFADVDGRSADMERRDNDMKADLETMFKMELIGRDAHHQTCMEQLLHDELGEIRERLDRIEAKA